MKTKQLKSIFKCLSGIIVPRIGNKFSAISFADGAVTATDGSILMEIKLPELSGSGVFDGATIQRYVKALSTKEVSLRIFDIEPETNNTESCKALEVLGAESKSKAEFFSNESVELFSIPNLIETPKIAINDPKAWFGGLCKCMLSVSMSSASSILDGVLLTPDGFAYATDRFRLTKIDLGQVLDGMENILLPFSVIKALNNLEFLANDFYAEYSIVDNLFVLYFPNTTIVVPFETKSDAVFDKCNDILGDHVDQCIHELVLNDEFFKAVARHEKTQRVISDGWEYSILFSCSGNEILLESETTGGRFLDKLMVESIVPIPFQFSMHPRYLSDLAKSGNENYNMYFDGHQTVILLTDKVSFWHLVICRQRG